jgi:hypothetical protein
MVSIGLPLSFTNFEHLHNPFVFIETNLPKRVAHMQLGLEREISEEEEENQDEGEPEYEYVTEDFEVVEEV